MRQRSNGRAFLIPFLLLLGTTVVSAGKVGAQDIPKGRIIRIHLTGSASAGTLSLGKVLPTSKGICRGKANWKDDCESEAAWVLKGSNLPSKWTVTVDKKAKQPDCFTSSSFTLDDSNRRLNSVPTGLVQEPPCARYSVWAYNVTLRNAAGDTVGPVVDPLIVIDYSGP